jgi:anti-anti-sigma factor
MSAGICIISEGLLGFLQEDEIRMLCTGIRNILHKHGGCWIFMDLCQYDLQKIAADALDESFEKIERMMNEGSARTAGTKGVSTPSRNPELIRKIMKECGLKQEEIPFWSDQVTVNTLKYLTDEKRTAFLNAARKLVAWRAVSDESESVSAERSVNAAGSGSTLTMEDDVLSVKLNGRIDSISAPDLLETYEKTAGSASFREVRVDAANLEYISSAGLRVLLLMIKASQEKKMSIEHANETVREILATTGFENMMQYIK